MRRQFHILYREFVFRIVDRELLSTYARGDMSKLILQVVALLVFLSLAFSIPALGFRSDWTLQRQSLFAATNIGFLIATTMLAVGLLAILSWQSMFPDRLDVLVLGPLPVRARTMFLARIAAVMTTLSLTVLSLHVATGFLWPLVLNRFSSGNLLRVHSAYWITMFLAGAFIFALVMSVQGVTLHALPRRMFLRVSPYLQFVALVSLISLYFLRPTASLWFLAMFEQLSGSRTVTGNARYAWLAVGLSLVVMMTTLALSYIRTMQQIAEAPEVTPVVRAARWLPRFGSRPATAIVHFAVRTAIRSAPHRVLLAFYWGVGCALTILFLKTPRGQSVVGAGSTGHDVSVPLLMSSLLLLVFAVIGARVVFALARDLPASWIFRVTPDQAGSTYVAARRRALLTLSVVPVSVLSAIVLFSLWSWYAAAGHVVVLALVGATLVELSVFGAPAIPCACAYLPGKSNVHLMFVFGVLFVVGAASASAVVEQQALRRLDYYIAMLGVVALAGWTARWIRHMSSLVEQSVRFEEVPADELVSLELSA